VPYGLLLVELVSNKLKHGYGVGQGGSVQVRLCRSASGPSLRVADSGRGLPDGFSLASPRTLGLQLAVSLARQLGGELGVEPGPGACFVATLPRL
jgi:two-component sensor histidine kinase